MYGIRGIDHLCRPGQLRRVLADSYPSGGSKLDPPLIRELIHNDQIQALNIPSGVLFQMHRAASTGQPGVLTDVGLGTYADPRIEGAKMNAVTDDFVQLMKVDGNEYLFYPAVNVDVAIIGATTADPYGNLSYEEECSARCARPGVRRPQQRQHRDRPGQKAFRYPVGHSGGSCPRHSRRRDRSRPQSDADHPDPL